MQIRLHFSRSSAASVCRILLGVILSTAAAFATDQNVSGNLTVSGSISSVGSIDSDNNSQSFGTQSTATPLVPGSVFTYTNDSVPAGTIDSFKSLVNRSAASWLWLNGPDGGPFVNAMRLDNAHQLILFGSDGTTAGLTFTPQTYTIKLGTNANATLTGNNSTGLITAGGGFTVAGPLVVSGGITNSVGSFGGETRFDKMPYTPLTSLTPTSGSASFAWGGVYVGTLTGNLTISSFSGTEAAGKKVRFVLLCSGTQSITFPASYRAGQNTGLWTTLNPAPGRHVFFFESLDGAGLRLLTDTYAGQLDAASVTVAATPANYSPASASVEAHLAAIDAKFGAIGGGGGSSIPPGMYFRWTTSDLSNKPSGSLVADGTNGTAALTPANGLTDLVMGNGSLAAPSFSPAPGTYSTTQNVTITYPAGATVKYTTDGTTTPSRSAGSTYSATLSIAATTTLKAMDFKNLSVDSGVTSGVYTIGVPTVYFGNTATGAATSLDYWGGYTFRTDNPAQPNTCPGTGTKVVQSLELWCKSAGGTPGVIKLAIYDTSLNLVGQGVATVTVSSTTLGWVGHITTSDLKPAGGTAGQPINLTGGTNYIFAWSSSAADTQIGFSTLIHAGHTQSVNYIAGFPNPLGGTETDSNELLCFRIGVQ